MSYILLDTASQIQCLLSQRHKHCNESIVAKHALMKKYEVFYFNGVIYKLYF